MTSTNFASDDNTSTVKVRLQTCYTTDVHADGSESDACTSVSGPADLDSTRSPKLITHSEQTVTDKPPQSPSILQEYSIKKFICLGDFTLKCNDTVIFMKHRSLRPCPV